ncbi:MAG TPA: ABC transporter permease [Gemmatimonadaceae bacterium]|nr:ABC transporter permease [Gemmatimonadaceae bacterium]
MAGTPRHRRLFRLSGTDSVEQQVDDEIGFHIDSRTQELIARGVEPSLARAQALREFGDAERARTELTAIDRTRVGHERRGEWWSALRQDVHFSGRSLRRAGGFTIAALLTLALGVGATGAIFSVVDGVLLRPLPYPNADRAVLLWTTAAINQPGADELPFSIANFRDARDQTHSFRHMAAFEAADFALASGEAPELIHGASVTSDLFSALGVTPMLGRAFESSDEVTGRPHVALLGYGLWQRKFGGDPSVIGREVRIGGESYTLIGVMPRGFAFPRGAELPSGLQFPSQSEMWTPAVFSSQRVEQRGSFNLAVLAELAPGATVAGANADLTTVMRRIGDDNEMARLKLGGAVVRLGERAVQPVRRSLLLLLGAVGFLLLIAGANVTNLLLARTAGRTQEFAVRAALGAGRRRLVRQLVTESAVLAIAGAICGLVAVTWAQAGLRALFPPSLPRAADVTLSIRVLLVSLGAAMVVGILAGIASAAQALAAGGSGSLREGRRVAGGMGRRRVRHALVVAEVALSVVLMIGGALLLQSFLHLHNVPAGFDSSGVVTAAIDIPVRPGAPFGADAAKWRAIMDGVASGVAARPGVEAVAAVSSLPLSGAWESSSIKVEGREERSDAVRPQAQYAMVTPGYFRAMGIPLLAGRDFTTHDDSAATSVVIISREAAARLFPGENPLGRRFFTLTDSALTVVGIVGDVRQTSLLDPIQAAIYIPYNQFALPYMTLVVRTPAAPTAIAPVLREEMRHVDAGVPITNVRSLAEVVDGSLAQRRLGMLLVGFFAVSALLLATVGLYGVIAYAVNQRSHELGVRVALGASPQEVARLVLKQGAMLAGGGLLAGIVGAVATSSLLRHQLFEVSPTDPKTFAAIGTLLFVVAMLASWVPARRATRVDPVRALRQE